MVNPKTFQAMFIFEERNTLPGCLKLKTNNTKITPPSSVEMLGVTIDNELTFDQHISRLCKSEVCQLNALFGLRNLYVFSVEQSINRKFYTYKFKLVRTDLTFLHIYIYKQKKSTQKMYYSFCVMISKVVIYKF